MLGAEHTTGSKYGAPQFHPLTIHWRMANGKVGWLKLKHGQPVNVTAGPRELALDGHGELSFQVYSPGAVQDEVICGHWQLNGLTIAVEGNCGPCVITTDEQDSDLLIITYPAPDTQPIQLRLLVS